MTRRVFPRVCQVSESVACRVHECETCDSTSSGKEQRHRQRQAKQQINNTGNWKRTSEAQIHHTQSSSWSRLTHWIRNTTRVSDQRTTIWSETQRADQLIKTTAWCNRHEESVISRVVSRAKWFHHDCDNCPRTPDVYVVPVYNDPLSGCSKM